MSEENLNEYLHEKLFGRCWHKFSRHTDPRIFWKCIFCNKSDLELREQAQNPDYCGSIHKAWKVVEKMREKGFYLTLQSPIISDAVDYFAAFVPHGAKGLQTEFVASADSPALAICQAARKVLEGETE